MESGPRRFIPTRRQWAKWSLPSRYAAVGLLLTLIGIVLTAYSIRAPREEGPSRDEAVRAERLLDEAWELIGRQGNARRLYRYESDRERLEDARDRIEEALILQPNSIKGTRYKAIYLSAIGRDEDAALLLRGLVRRAPQDGPVLGELAGVERALGNLADAAQLAERAIKLDPREPALHANLGLTRLQQGRLIDARVAFERAIHLDAQDAVARFNLADVLWRLGEAELARRELGVALEIKPSLSEFVVPGALDAE